MPENYLDLSQILKGSISATDTTLSGELHAQVAHAFVDAIKDNSKFLQKITTEKMKKITKELDAWDVARGVLVRVPSGDKPTDEQRKKLDVIGCTLESKPVQLFARVLQDALEENADNPKFEQETFSAFTKAFGNDLALLGFIGEKDDYADKKFENLNKGWFQVIKDSTDAKKITYAANAKQVTRLTALVDNIHDDVFGEAVILINPKDYRAYQKELSENAAASILVKGDAKEILGVPLEVNPLVKEGEYLATPLKNLVLGLGINIRRNRWYDGEERALKYVFDLYCDYEVVIKKWTTLSTKTGG